jgi:hypothetical protein
MPVIVILTKNRNLAETSHHKRNSFMQKILISVDFTCSFLLTSLYFAYPLSQNNIFLFDINQFHQFILQHRKLILKLLPFFPRSLL